ncbi:unnamed protein product [Meganyctiphanes norvegica]|uniref:Uncharacterized protein n=1 Tax=Meganyctiphanes norvegica TaxID=48144 RepID=A0AAV2R3F9_MEGNR
MYSPAEDQYMADKRFGTIVTINRKEIDREMSPILAELMTLGHGNEQHPAVKELFNWLVDPQRTGEEFAHVIGELADDVFMVMKARFLKYVYDEGYCMYLFKVAAEALAVKCPILEGSWEQAAWTLMTVSFIKHNFDIEVDNNLESEFHSDSKEPEYSVASDCLSAWVIHVIGDPDICPNPYLRIELMWLLLRMVNINDCNRTQVIESILYACSSFDIEYTSRSLLEYHKIHKIDSVLSVCSFPNIDYLLTNLPKYRQIGLIDISHIFSKLAKDGHLCEFDMKFSEKLCEVKASRISAIVRDVGYRCEVNPTRFTEPREFYGLNALFMISRGTIERAFVELQKENFNPFYVLAEIKAVSDLLITLISNLKVSCQVPQLVELVAECISGIMEVMTIINVDELGRVREVIHKRIKEKIINLLRQVSGELRSLVSDEIQNFLRYA